MFCKAEASDNAHVKSSLLAEEDKYKISKLPKSKHNKEELSCKAEANACAPEEPILLPEEMKKKENL